MPAAIAAAMPLALSSTTRHAAGGSRGLNRDAQLGEHLCQNAHRDRLAVDDHAVAVENEQRKRMTVARHVSASLRPAFYCLTAVLLSACATGRDVVGLEEPPGNAPLKLIVVESPMSVGAARLQPVLAPPAKRGSSAAVARIARGEAHAQEFALASMDAALRKRTGLEVVESPQREVAATDYDSPLTQADADRLRSATGADALLRFRITDYGLTPKSWRKGYIAFEVASTLAIAGLIAYQGTTAAKAAAGAYLTQETIEESAEAYAGFGALGVVWRPVRVEAKLERLHPLATLWSESDTGLSDTRLSRVFGKVSSAERDGQLDRATRRAVKDLASELPVGSAG